MAMTDITRQHEFRMKPKSPIPPIEDQARQKLHVYANEDTLKQFLEGYQKDKAFKTLMICSQTEGFNEKKYHAYRIGINGLLYFEDADSKLRLCVPESEHQEILKETHDYAHESTHAGWERTLTAMRECFYWPCMRSDVVKYVQTCDPCQKIKHS